MEDLHFLLDSMRELSERDRLAQSRSMVGAQDAESLILKVFCHLSAASQLTAGTYVRGREKPFIDPATIPVICRAAWEAVLVLSYVFAMPPSETEKILRYKLWKLSGLLDRSRYGALSPAGRRVLDSDAEIIRALRDELHADPKLSGLTKGQRLKLLERGGWRIPGTAGCDLKSIPSWRMIAIASGFGEKTTNEVYSFFSGYAHSSYLSVMQLGQATKESDRQNMVDAHVSVSCIIAAFAIRVYSDVFEEVKRYISENSVLDKVLSVWQYVGEDEILNEDVDWDEELGDLDV